MECENLIFDDHNQIIRGEKKGFLATDVRRSYDSIHQYQLFTENHTDVGTSMGFGLGRAIVGGALLGPAGAVLAGLTKRNVNSNSYTTCTVAISFNFGESISVTTTFDKAMDYMRSLDRAYQMVHSDEIPQISQNSVEIEALQKQISELTESLTNKEEPIVINSSADANSLIKRAFSFLENEEWKKAEAYCESALDIEPEKAEAYLVKLMVELKISTLDALAEQNKSFEENANYKNVLQYASPELSSKMLYYATEVKCRPLYDKAKRLLDCAKSIRECEDATKLFHQISNYADCSKYLEKCEMKKAEILETEYASLKNQMKSADNENQYRVLATKFRGLSSYKDSSSYMNICIQKADECKIDALYNDAIEEINADNLISLENAKLYLQQCNTWKDSEKLLMQVNSRIEEIRRSNEKARAKKERRKKCIVCITIISTIIIVLGIICYFNSDRYLKKKANTLIQQSDYYVALDVCQQISDSETKQVLYKQIANEASNYPDYFKAAEDACKLIEDTTIKQKLHTQIYIQKVNNAIAEEDSIAALEFCKQIEDPTVQQEIFVQAADKAIDAEDYYTAGSYVDEIKDISTKQKMYTKIVKQASNSDFAVALFCCDKITDTSLKQSLYVEMTVQAINNDNYDAACNACYYIKKVSKKQKLFIQIAKHAEDNDTFYSSYRGRNFAIFMLHETGMNVDAIVQKTGIDYDSVNSAIEEYTDR